MRRIGRAFLLSWIGLGAAGGAAEPVKAEDWARRGRELWKVDKEAAIDAFTRALKVDPAFQGARYDRALLYMETDRAREAMADLRALEQAAFEGAARLRALMATIADAHTSIAGRWTQEGQLEAALDKLNVVLVYQPDHADAHAVRGIVYANLGKLKEAMADYDRAIALDPQAPEPYYNRGLLHARRSDYRRAVADFTRAIERSPDEPSYYEERGTAHAALGQGEAARRDLETSARLQSEALARGATKAPPR